jgi:hypothetical protein
MQLQVSIVRTMIHLHCIFECVRKRQRVLSYRTFVAEIRGDPSPPAVFGALLANEWSRKAVSTFCEQVMLRIVHPLARGNGSPILK